MRSLAVWYNGTNVSDDPTASIFRKNMQAKGYSETLITFYPTKSRNIPEDGNFQIVITSQITKTNRRKRELSYL
jgi:hypothetical protein